MSRVKGAICFLLLAGVFLLWNRYSYRGYFQTDEIDNVNWTPHVDAIDYLKTSVSPQFQPNNFRPVGHYFFREGSLLFGLTFWKYVAVVHFFHLFNVWLLWLAIRRLGSSVFPAAVACIFFALHAALFDAVWKPMYVFDVLCATFCLLSLLCYLRQRWILSFICYWAAYRSKELAVMLPFVFLAYECMLRPRGAGQEKKTLNWKPLAVFFAASISFGIQGLIWNPNKNNEYTFRFTGAALIATASFYGAKLFLLPYAGYLLPIATAFSRNRRAWFGAIAMGVFFIPLLFLPGRLFSAYCYVPFTGLAIALSGLTEAFGILPGAIFLLAFLPLDYRAFRAQRDETLALDRDVKSWITTAARFARSKPEIDTVVFAASPRGFGRSGAEAALRYVFQDQGLPIVYTDDKEAPALAHREKVAFLTWDFDTHRLYIQSHTPNLPDAPYLDLKYSSPVWQLEEGWLDQEGDHRWTNPVATARLARPAGARIFQLNVDLFDDQLKAGGPVTIHVSLNGEPLPPQTITKPWWNTIEWQLTPAIESKVLVKIESSPAYRNGPKTRGIAVGGFGFLTRSGQS
jgi:hypothetical protein